MKPVLAVVAALLAAVIGMQWGGWPPEPPRGAAPARGVTPKESTPAKEENPLERLTPLGDKEEYAVVIERPLFLSDRRPPADEPEEEAAAPAPEKGIDVERLDLNAVLITPSESSAWVRDPSQKDLVRLRPGDEVAGWAVQEILSDRLLLERQGETDTLVLRDYKNMPPPAPPPRQRPPARKPQRQTPQKGAGQPESDGQQQNTGRTNTNRPKVQPRRRVRSPQTQMHAPPTGQ